MDIVEKPTVRGGVCTAPKACYSICIELTAEKKKKKKT